jgi:hypothetical protein
VQHYGVVNTDESTTSIKKAARAVLFFLQTNFRKKTEKNTETATQIDSHFTHTHHSLHLSDESAAVANKAARGFVLRKLQKEHGNVVERGASECA